MLSIAGAAVIVFKAPGQDEFLMGFLILQVANIAFAIGQWNYQRWADQSSNAGNMAWMYLGAALFASLLSFPQLNWSEVVITWKSIFDQTPKSLDINKIIEWVDNTPGYGQYHLHGWKGDEGFAFRFEGSRDATHFKLIWG